MLPNVYEVLNGDSDVQGLVGTRIYRHGKAPQKVSYPYITWHVIVGTPENKLSGTPDVDRVEVQIDCWSNNTGTGDAQVTELAQAVRNAVEPVAHMTSIEDDEQDDETKSFRIGMIFTFWNARN